MSYYIVNIAIRWANGDLEGFRSSGLTEDGARQRAIQKAVNKSREMHIQGQFVHLTKSQYDALSCDEQDQLQMDWEGSTA